MKKYLSLRAVFLLLFCFTVTAFAAPEDKRFDIPLGDGPVLGPADAPVTMIEFLDFQ